jgi:putative flippase GtrA
VTTDLAARLERVARHSAVRFAVVGGLSLVADAGSLVVFYDLLGIWLPLATVLAYGVAFVVNFGLNRLWAFQAHGAPGGAVGRQLRRYTYLVLANLVLTVILVPGLTWSGLPYLVAKVGTAVALAVANYVVSRRWIFV